MRIRGKSACVKGNWRCVKSRLLQQQSELLLHKLAQWLSFTCNEIIIPPGRVRSIKSSPPHPPAPLHIVSWCDVRCVANSSFTSIVACSVGCKAAAPVSAFQTAHFEVSSWRAMEISHLECYERPVLSSTCVFMVGSILGLYFALPPH